MVDMDDVREEEVTVVAVMADTAVVAVMAVVMVVVVATMGVVVPGTLGVARRADGEIRSGPWTMLALGLV